MQADNKIKRRLLAITGRLDCYHQVWIKDRIRIVICHPREEQLRGQDRPTGRLDLNVDVLSSPWIQPWHDRH